MRPGGRGADTRCMRLGLCLVSAMALAAPGVASPDSLSASSSVAALQVALRAEALYGGTIDGRLGPETTEALVTFQRRSGLTPDGIPGPRTRRALGPLGGPSLGARPLAFGAVGWDVAELQFRLAWRGFPSGAFDGIFGARLHRAVERFQRHARLPQVGFAGPRTLAALGWPAPSSPVLLAAPVAAPTGDGFGPRGDRFHTGLDFRAPAGTAVLAAAGGIVTWAAPRGSYGNTVVVAHGRGVRTLYAHLSRVDLAVGRRISVGTVLGLVGSTGNSTGPHLHFEVLVRGAAVDPATALG